LNKYITGTLEGGKTSPFKNIAGLAEKLQPGGRGYEHHEKLDAGAAVIAGGLGMGTASAQSFEFGVYSHGPAAYIPPCPGPGYVWVAGYEANGYWIPGRWNFIGVRDGDRDRFARFEGDRGWGRYNDLDRDRDRRCDRDRDSDRDRFRR
jgi:hypothetical protein